MRHQDCSGLAQKYSPVDLLLSFSNHSEMVGGGYNLFIQHTSVDHMEIAIGAKETQPPPWMVFNGLCEGHSCSKSISFNNALSIIKYISIHSMTSISLVSQPTNIDCSDVRICKTCVTCANIASFHSSTKMSSPAPCPGRKQP